MNKKLGKTLAAVLSAAMAVSAFAMSTSASFAASNSVSFASATQYVALTTNTTDDYQLDPGMGATVTVNGHTFPVNLTWAEKSKWTTNRTDLVSVTDDGKVTIKNQNISQVQKVTFTRTAKATANVEATEHGELDEITGQNITVTVVAYIYPDGSLMVLPESEVKAYNDDKTDMPESNLTVSINDEAKFDVYQVGTADDGTATFTDYSDDVEYKSSNGNFKVDEKGDFAAQKPDDVKTGTTTVSAEITDERVSSATLKVENTYHVTGPTTITSEARPGYATKSVTDVDDYDVTNLDIIADADVEVSEKATVGDITAGASTIEIYGATAGNITSKGTVAVGTEHVTEPTTVGNVSAGTVYVAGAEDQDDDEQYAKVTVGDIDAGTAYISADDTEDGPMGAVEAGNITVSNRLLLRAGVNYSAVEVGTVSGVEGPLETCPYGAELIVEQGTFDLGDLTYFGHIEIGTADDKANVTVGEINTGKQDDSGDYCEITSDSTLNVADNSTLTADYIGVTNVAGSGTIQVPANSFEITGSINDNPTLIVENVKKGDVLYKTAENMENKFIIPGVTAVKASEPDNLNWYTYTADGIEFRGITMDQQKVEVGTSPVTLSLSKVPASADLPEGVTVEWTANKDSVTLTPSADGMSCTVAATGYTEQNINGSNDVIVTAQLYKDGEPYDEFGTQFASASSQVTLTNKAPETPANPFTVVVTNAEGEEIACAADGTTVVEVPQSMAFNFSISSADTVENFDYTTGNGEIGGTNTNTVWNGTEGSYQIYAAGDVDSETGVYVNGIKIFTLKVGARPFTSDTTLDVDLNVGQKYQFEITLDNPEAPFTFLTADGQAVSTSYNPDTYPAENGKYYCSVTAQQAGRDIGVYCEIDGKTYKIFTAHTH